MLLSLEVGAREEEGRLLMAREEEGRLLMAPTRQATDLALGLCRKYV